MRPRILLALAAGLMCLACDGLKTRPDCEGGRAPSPDILGDALDNDCDGVVDERAVFNDRVHCGGAWHSCVLEPGEVDVLCEAGRCVGVGETAEYEDASECLDGIDNPGADGVGNGIIDDGPHCEALVTNAASTDCNGRAPSAECPPAGITMGDDTPPSTGIKDDDWPRHAVHLTYDFLIDRHEVSRRQFKQHLRAAGRCEGEEQHRLCGLSDELDDPIDEVTWCEAYDYCTAAGKRLPTEAEWSRLAQGRGRPATSYPWSGMPTSQDPPAFPGLGIITPRPNLPIAECQNTGVIAKDCEGEGALPMAPSQQNGGWVVLGDYRPERISPGPPQQVGRAVSVQHVGGNAAEWTFDAFQHYCDLLGVDCFDVAARREAAPRVDPAVSTERDGEVKITRTARGGSYQNPLDSTRYYNRQRHPSIELSAGQGFRCARTFAPTPEARERLAMQPYDASMPSDEWTTCVGNAPPGPRIATPRARLKALCIPELHAAGGAVLGALSYIQNVLTDKLPPSLLVLGFTPLDGGASTLLSFGSAVVVDDDLHWIAGDRSASTRVDGECAPGGCSVSPWPAEAARMSLWSEVDSSYALDLELQDFVPGEIADLGCGITPTTARAGDVLYVAQVTVMPSSTLDIVGNSLPSRLCQYLPDLCVQDGVDCVTACPGWGMTLQMLFRPEP